MNGTMFYRVFQKRTALPFLLDIASVLTPWYYPITTNDSRASFSPRKRENQLEGFSFELNQPFLFIPEGSYRAISAFIVKNGITVNIDGNETTVWFPYTKEQDLFAPSLFLEGQNAEKGILLGSEQKLFVTEGAARMYLPTTKIQLIFEGYLQIAREDYPLDYLELES